MVDLQIIETVGILGTAIATVALVLLLWKAVKQMEYTVSLSRVQTDMRFRPWVGPSSGITHVEETAKSNNQYQITVRNFGEIPAQAVNVFFKQDSKLLTRDDLKQDSLRPFNLGPVLPGMEKKYWVYIDSELMQKAKNDQEQIFTLIYFEYQAGSSTSGYGMISQYDAVKNIFVHKDMWVDTQN